MSKKETDIEKEIERLARKTNIIDYNDDTISRYREKLKKI